MSVLSTPADTACDNMKPNPAYKRHTLHPAKEPEEEGDYADIEDI